MSWLRKIPFLGRLFGPNPSGSMPQTSVEDFVVRVQGFGLLVGRSRDELLRRFEAKWEFPFDPQEWSSRAMLLALDEEHVWFDDTEADVCAENQVYCSFLRALAAISGGAFDPQQITEVWESDEGPITVSFVLGGKRHEVRPSFQDDWIDMEVLGQINALMTTHRFAYWAVDQMALVLCPRRDVLQTIEASGLLPREFRGLGS